MTTFSMDSNVMYCKDFSKDDRFMHVKLALCTSYQIANRMKFDHDLLASKMSEIDFMPVVGAIHVVEKSDGTVAYKLGSHEVEMDIQNGELVTKKNTIVLGVALPNTAKFEDVSRHGQTQEYITFEALLFQEKYPQLRNVINLDTDASMELSDMDVEYDEENECFNVKDFKFLSHCLIGAPPAFKLAGVTEQFSMDDFKLEFAEILEDIKSSLNKFNETEDVKGGDEVAKKKAELNEDVKPKEDVLELTENEMSNEELASTEDETEPKKDDESKEEEEPKEGKEELAEDKTDDNDEEPKEEEKPKEDEESKEDEQPINYEAMYNDIQAKFNELLESHTTLNAEVETLRAFKQDIEDKQVKEQAEMELQAKKDEVAKFSSRLSDEEISNVICNVEDLSLVEITSKLSIALANKLLADNSNEESGHNFANIDNTPQTYSRHERLVAELKSKQK